MLTDGEITQSTDDDVSPSPGFVLLMHNAVKFALQAYQSGDVGTDQEVRPGKLSAVLFEITQDFKHSDEGNLILGADSIICAISIIDSLIDQSNCADPNRHELFFHLAIALRRRIETQASLDTGRSETLVDLYRALFRSIALFRKAAEASPDLFEVHARYFYELGYTCSMVSTLFAISWDRKNVLDLLQVEREHAGEAELTGIVPAVILASTLSTAYGVTQEPRYREEGRNLYRGFLGSIGAALPINEVMDHTETLDASSLEALSFMTDAFIPFIVQLMALLMQRLVEVPLSAVIGRQAAAVAISMHFKMPFIGQILFKLHERGVEWLEQCLMVVWGQAKLRAPAPADAIRVHGVREADPDGKMGQVLFSFLGLCIHVDMVVDGQSSIAKPEQIAFKLILEWFGLLRTARDNPSFADLYKPRPFAHLLTAARHAPVIMINLWGTQCDALIIQQDGGCLPVRLEGVTEDFAAKLQKMFRGGLYSLNFRSRGDEDADDTERGLVLSSLSEIERVLGSLWRKVVKPIFDAMQLEPVENDELDPPRLTWCLTGPTTFFPLHAAGLYDTDDKGSKTYEYVASSYTPTLSILADANDSLSLLDEPPFKGVLAVSQPNAPGLKSIPKTFYEAGALMKAVSEAHQDPVITAQWLDGDKATKDAVLSGMQSSTWVHLACHARQYPLNTSESAFILANGEKLTLADIIGTPAADGELAFLSACQTAAGDFDLSEEGVHLAASMLVAGYRSVIATTWSVRDSDAPVIAEAVYRRLLREGRVDRTGAALALHHATRLLRKDLLRQQPDQPEFLRWAAFIHLGV